MRLRPIHAARAAALLLLAASSACSAPEGPCAQRAPAGVYVTRTTLEGIEPGTEQRQVRTMLGDPTAIDRIDGRELWIWCCDTIEAPRSDVVRLTRRAPCPASTTARIEFEAGRVVRAWLETSTTVASND